MKSLLARISPLTAALGALAVALVVLIVMLLVSGTQTRELLATAAKSPKLPELKLDAPAPESRLDVVRDRTLFSASRAFYVAPPAPLTPPAPPRPNYLLAGTFVIPRKHTVALLKPSAAGSVVKVKAGDDLEGWHIESVDGTRVVLSYHDERFEIARTPRESGGRLTRAPLKRPGSAAVPVAVPVPEATFPAAGTTVKSLGNGRSGAIRDASVRSTPSFTEARLYRPPPQ
jgi:hypothetical protein